MPNVAAHKLVLETAQKMAGELYDEVMSGNAMYAGWKEMTIKKGLTAEQSQRLFVALIAPKLLEPARAILASVLADPSKEHLHETIYDSMLLDNAIRASRLRPNGRPKLSLPTEDEISAMRKVNADS
jgi:hypothetical protein